MGKFEDQLLSELMREHGPTLAEAKRPRRRKAKPMWIAASAVAVAAASTGAVVLTSVGDGASAVTEHADGSITVTVGADGIDKVNKELQDRELKVRLSPDVAEKCVLASVPLPVKSGESVELTTDLLKDAKVAPATKVKVEMSADGRIMLVPVDCVKPK